MLNVWNIRQSFREIDNSIYNTGYYPPSQQKRIQDEITEFGDVKHLLYPENQGATAGRLKFVKPLNYH